jgi:hypothetical protein
MKKDMIQDIWEKDKAQKKEISMRDIEQAIRPSIRHQTFTFKIFIWIWLLIIFATLVLNGMNISGYAINPPMLITHLILTLVTITFGIYGVHLLSELRIIEQADESLLSVLKRRLRFYRSKYEIWNLMMAAMIPLLSFALNSYIDNQNGIYRINRPLIFFGVTLLQFIFCYVIIKIGQYPVLKEIKIFLSDLEAQILEGTQKLTGMKKKWRQWAIILAIIGTLLLLWGIWQAIQFGR